MWREHDNDRFNAPYGMLQVLGALHLHIHGHACKIALRRPSKAGERDTGHTILRHQERQLTRQSGRQLARITDVPTKGLPPGVQCHFFAFPARVGVEITLAVPPVTATPSNIAPRAVILMVDGLGSLAEGRSMVTLNAPSLAFATRL